MVIVQTDAASGPATIEIEQLRAALSAAGADIAVADDPLGAETLMAGRRMVVTAFEQMGATLIDDVCVPKDRLVSLVDGVESIASQHEVIVGLVGHAGDGNFNPSVVFDQSDPHEVARARAAFTRRHGACARAGGTITGEHGVGLLKREMLRREAGTVAVDPQRRIKYMFDPSNLLHSTKVIAQ